MLHLIVKTDDLACDFYYELKTQKIKLLFLKKSRVSTNNINVKNKENEMKQSITLDLR